MAGSDGAPATGDQDDSAASPGPADDGPTAAPGSDHGATATPRAQERGATAGPGPASPGWGAGTGEEQRNADVPRAALKPGSAARTRRRIVEAELIGLPGGHGPDWWEPCWERGVDGGMPPNRLFDTLARFHPDVRVLHGLGVAGTTTVIDHVLVGAGGVVVAGTESCPGRVKSDGVHLRVRGRDRSPLIDVALWRAEVVRASLAQRGFRDVPVHGVVHWEHLEGLGDRAIALRGVPLLSAGAAVGMAARGIELSPLAIERIVAALAPATTPA